MMNFSMTKKKTNRQVEREKKKGKLSFRLRELEKQETKKELKEYADKQI